MMRSAAYWKERLQLIGHIEGGAYKETYRAPLVLLQGTLTKKHKGDRAAATGIYFLLEHGEFSAFHRIASDEMWHFYDGGTLAVYEIKKDGSLIKHLLGTDIGNGALPQIVIPAGSWFASRVETEASYTLCGCTVAPGFDFADFELGSRKELTKEFPQHEALIVSLTR